MQAGVVGAQVFHLHRLDGLDGRLGDEVDPVAPGPGELFQGVEQGGGGAAHQVRGLAAHQAAVGQFDGHGGLAGLPGHPVGLGDHGADVGGNAGLLHEQLQLIDGAVAALALAALAQGVVIPADDLLPGGLLTGLVVHDAVARHVYPHVGGGLIGAAAQDLLEHGGQDGEDLHVPVIVHRGLPIGLEVEGVDHVHVVQVGGGRLVGQVHRVLQGQVPDGEGLELGVARHHAPLVVVVELAQAGGHFAAARAGGGDHHQGAAGLQILVFAKALVADNLGDVVGIALDGIVAADLDAQALQPGLKQVGGGLAGIAGDHHAAHRQAPAAEDVDEPQHVAVIGDAQVAPDLVLLDVPGVDGDDDLRLVLQLLQHADLAVWLESGQHPGGVVVVKQLAAELQIQLSAELRDAVPDVLRLHLQVLLVVKADFCQGDLPL